MEATVARLGSLRGGDSLIKYPEAMKSLKAIVVGAGYFSRFQYEAWTRIPEVQVVAAVNRTVDKLRPFKETYAIPRIASLDELETVIDEERPDFIDLVTPPESHLDIVRLAARKGVHVICQKPLAPTMEEAREVVATANGAGIRFLVHENWRWQPWYRKMRALLDEGAIGSLHSIAVRMRMGDGWQEDAYLARQPFFRNYPRLLIYETGVHFLDTFRFLRSGGFQPAFARYASRRFQRCPEFLKQPSLTTRCGDFTVSVRGAGTSLRRRPPSLRVAALPSVTPASTP